MMKIAVVTGASSGMGREFAVQLEKYEKFDEMWVIARREERLKTLCECVGCKVRTIAMDLTDKACLDEYSRLLEQYSPQVLALINCSGFGKFGSYKDIPIEESMNMIELNCKALTYITEATLLYMQQGAKILELDSLSAFQPVPYLNVYAATKAYVLSYTRSLNHELKSRKIHAMAVCPGWVKTEFFDRAKQSSDSAVTYFNKVYEPGDIVAKALHDLYKTKKDVSIYGARIRLQVFAVKLLPHKIVMKIWSKQQKH